MGGREHAANATGYFDARRTGSGVLHNLDPTDYLQHATTVGTAIRLTGRTGLGNSADACSYLPAIALVG
jgi:hypothetical protein